MLTYSSASPSTDLPKVSVLDLVDSKLKDVTCSYFVFWHVCRRGYDRRLMKQDDVCTYGRKRIAFDPNNGIVESQKEHLQNAYPHLRRKSSRFDMNRHVRLTYS